MIQVVCIYIYANAAPTISGMGKFVPNKTPAPTPIPRRFTSLGPRAVNSLPLTPSKNRASPPFITEQFTAAKLTPDSSAANPGSFKLSIMTLGNSMGITG